jgi:hypothetical protein
MRRILIGVAIACVIVAGALAWHAATTSDYARSVRGEATRIEHDTKLITAKAAAERRQSGAISKRTSDAYRAMSDVDGETADVAAAGDTEDVARRPLDRDYRCGCRRAAAGRRARCEQPGRRRSRPRASTPERGAGRARRRRPHGMNAAVNNAITALENAGAAYSPASNGEPV